MNETAARQLLTTARRALLRARRGLTDDGLAHPGSGGSDVVELTDDDTELPALLTEEELDRSVMNELQAQLAEVAAAEERLDAGTYGRCEHCAQAIPEERLKAIPWARFCVAHQAAAEVPSDWSVPD